MQQSNNSALAQEAKIIEGSIIERYKDLIKRALNGETVDFGIDTTKSEEARKRIELLKKAYDLVVPPRESTGFWGFIGRAVPVIGAIYATKERNNLLQETKVKDAILKIQEKILTNSVIETSDLRSTVNIMQQNMNTMMTEQRIRDAERDRRDAEQKEMLQQLLQQQGIQPKNQTTNWVKKII